MSFYSNISKLTSWLIPARDLRVRYRDFWTYLDFKDELAGTELNYQNVLEGIRNKKDKIKVLFLVRENQKWTYQSLYEIFENSENFEPIIGISLLELARKGKDKTRNNLDENFIFFKNRGMNVEYVYKDDEYVDLREFKPDIVFYDQPWDLPSIHHPKNVSKFALTFYSSYGYEIVKCPEDYTINFHRFLYRFFVEHEYNIQRYEQYYKGNSKNCVAVGYPKLDGYFKEKKSCNIWKDGSKLKIIYAPHHSLEKKGLRLATFDKNGKYILELAKKHPETTWVFKPHSRLKYALLRTKTMTKKEVDEYFNEWAKIGTVYENGNYIDLFRSSDLMITDSCSFLAEYLPTEKPLIRLINKHGIKPNKLGEKITKGYYFAKNNSDIELLFSDIIKNGNDSKKIVRKELINEIMDSSEMSSDKVYKCILKCLEDI